MIFLVNELLTTDILYSIIHISMTERVYYKQPLWFVLAVAVKDKRILATGYNGAPSKVAHCLDIGCLREQLGVPSGQRHEICRGLHAEQNVIIQAAVHGISLAGAEVYCTHQPCLICSKMLINCGITKIWYASGYPDELAMQMLNEADITLELLPLRPTPDGCGHTGPSGEGA